MRFVHRKKFVKGLAILSANRKKRVGEIIRLFEENPFNPQLNNHALHGKLKDLRSISAGGDLRITFFEEDNYEVVYLVCIGTHNQVY
jgi:mRNA-degrading endonuclease YafQ of YafQ-DinJ toxin-antitoxin module